MGTLKRFSYDNIVEHNPTAPDPVDYEGGGEGGDGSGIETVVFDEANDPVTANRTFQEVFNLLTSGVPVIACASGSATGTSVKHFILLHVSSGNGPNTYIYGNYVSVDPFENGMFGVSYRWTDDGIMRIPFNYIMTPAS